MDSRDTRQLVSDCLAERPEAMAQLVARFRGRVLHLCFRMLGQWQDAEDAAQETFLRVARNLRQWDSGREFEPWLLTIAANRCRTLLARRQKQIAAGSFPTEMTADNRAAVSRQADLLAEEVDAVLETLPEDWVAAFRLFHEDALDYRQIARRMDRPLGTVKTWVHRCRLQLIERLRRRGSLTG